MVCVFVINEFSPVTLSEILHGDGKSNFQGTLVRERPVDPNKGMHKQARTGLIRGGRMKISVASEI